jgi:hypothetical protein
VSARDLLDASALMRQQTQTVRIGGPPSWKSIWHIGFAVPGLEKGKKELGDVFGLSWRPSRSSARPSDAVTIYTTDLRKKHSDA